MSEMRRSLEVAVKLGAGKIVLLPSIVNGMGAFVRDTVKGYAFDFLTEMHILILCRSVSEVNATV